MQRIFFFSDLNLQNFPKNHPCFTIGSKQVVANIKGFLNNSTSTFALLTNLVRSLFLGCKIQKCMFCSTYSIVEKFQQKNVVESRT